MTRPAYPFHYSEITTAQHCPQKYDYKYIQGLRRVRATLPMARGTWVHFGLQLAHVEKGTCEQTLLERVSDVESPTGGYWPTAHIVKKGWRHCLWNSLEAFWHDLSDDAVSEYTEDGATLPEAVLSIMDGWMLAYRNAFTRQKVLLVEHEWRRDWEGYAKRMAQGKVDLVRELDGFVDLIDWKTTKREPDTTYQMMDGQRLWYTWGVYPVVKKAGLDINRIVFQYILTKLPGTPKPLKAGGYFGRGHGSTTAPVYLKAMRASEFKLDQPAYKPDKAHPEPPTHREVVQDLAVNQKFYFDRILPITAGAWNSTASDMAAGALFAEGLHSGHAPQFRNISYLCKGCEFRDICRADQWGEDSSVLQEQMFEYHDPYTDEDEESNDEHDD